ncbi:hypothetical protein Q7A53_06180 [Halobacillus rhizosphaerae]|uniref:hypothetical protein n=1 Tax=Halobacillus rhizosphaerae TaxID=3064889 RepID=UPI00398B1B48
MNKRYGLKEVANVIFFDISTGKPSLFFDTLKVSSISNESDSAEANGGQGNNRLMTWDYGRKATLAMQDALLSDQSLAMLAGTTAKTTGITATGRDVLTIENGSVTLKQEPKAGRPVTFYGYSNGVLTEEATATVDGTDPQLFDVVVSNGETEVMAFYEYDAPADSVQITFSGKQFPATYRVVGETVVKGEDGLFRKMQFVIAKAKLQSSFELAMDAENVSTFDFNLDILTDTSTEEFKLYDIIRLG